jgi:hypothetical protein
MPGIVVGIVQARRVGLHQTIDRFGMNLAFQLVVCAPIEALCDLCQMAHWCRGMKRTCFRVVQMLERVVLCASDLSVSCVLRRSAHTSLRGIAYCIVCAFRGL